MKMQFLEGVNDVGGMTTIEFANGLTVLVDAGGPIGDDVTERRRSESIGHLRKVDAIVISHGHLDHIFMLPAVSRLFPAAPIYATETTAILMEYNLNDSLNLATERETFLGWEEEDLNRTLARVTPIAFSRWHPMGDNAAVGFLPSGHVQGAASPLIKVGNEIPFFSGDVCLEAQSTVGGADWSFLRTESVTPTVYVTEGTYGNRDLPTKRQAWAQFYEICAETIHGGGTVLCPALTIGRSQEALIHAMRFCMKNRFEIPIIVDGSARDMTQLFAELGAIPQDILADNQIRAHATSCAYSVFTQALAYPHVHFVKRNDKGADRKKWLRYEKPSIIISPSGMAQGGAIWSHLDRHAGRKENTLIFSSFLAPGTLGEQIFESKGIPHTRIWHEDPAGRKRQTTFNCRIERIAASAHADRHDLKTLAESVNAEHLFIHHADQEAAEGLKWLLEDRYPNAIIPERFTAYDV